MANAEPTGRLLSNGAHVRSAFAGLRRRLPLYVLVLLAGVLVLAYVDGGEEPLHPIVQEVAMPQSEEAAS